MKVESRIKMVERSSPESLELARWVCLATRIEPALLRRARLGLMTKASASAESDLWLGPLVQTRGARFILLYPEVSDYLRKKLAENSGDLAKAWKLLRRTHRYMPELVRLEEKLTWLTLKGGANLEERIDARLRPVIKAIVANQRAGLGRWALGILPRLPENARTRTARLLQMISESHLYGSWSSLLTASEEESSGVELSDEERALFLHNLEQTPVGIRLLEGRLEVSEPPADGSQIINVPTTNPRVLELTVPDGERQEKLIWRQGEQVFAHNVIAPITISTLAGESYQVVSQRNVIKALREKVLPFTVTIHNINYTPVAAGLLVDDHHAITTTSSLEKSGRRVKSSSFKEERVLISFPVSNEEPFFARVIAGVERSNPSSISDGLVLIEFERAATGARPARLDQTTDDLVGKPGVIFSYQPYQRSRLSRFEVTAEMLDGSHKLKPVTKLSKEALESLSGSPLVDPKSGDVMGMLSLLTDTDGSIPILVPRTILSHAIPRTSPEPEPSASWPPRIDIYISYSHLDNQSVSNEKGWVDTFHARLNDVLIKYLGREVNSWRDTKLQGTDYFSYQIEDALRNSAIMVAVVSPAYINSEWCLKELEMFSKHAEESGRLRIGNKSRVIKVEKFPTPREKLPEPLQGMIGYQFFEVDDKTGRAREFDARSNLDQKYWDKVNDLAFDIKSMMEEVQHESFRQTPAPSIEETVYLAETTSELAQERDRIKRELMDRGYVVLPDKELPYEATQMKQAVHEYLKRSRLSIHLIGSRYGWIPEGEERSITHIQNELAAERSYDHQFRRLIWIPQGLQANDERQREFINYLKSDEKAQMGAELMERSLEELRTRLLQKLTDPAPAAFKKDRSSIYLIYDRPDHDSVLPLARYFSDRGYEVLSRIEMQDREEVSIQQYHKESLRNCDAALIYYGHANEFWLYAQLSNLRKARAFRSEPFKASAVYIAPPVTHHKEEFKSREGMVIKNFQEFNEELLSGFVAQIEASME